MCRLTFSSSSDSTACVRSEPTNRGGRPGTYEIEEEEARRNGGGSSCQDTKMQKETCDNHVVVRTRKG
jgi:hypothetical protein